MSDLEKTAISQQLDDFKEFFGKRLDRIEQQLDGKCETCTHVPKFTERLRSQWFHICTLWLAIVGLGTYFYNHIVGK